MDMAFDVLIAGTGVSGLYCALNLRSDLNILLISKSRITDTNTYLAQGGISTARNTEDIPLFVEDTLKAGQYKNKEESVRILAEESRNNISQLVDLGVRFDKTDNGFSYTREGAHSINRIVHSKDTTGKAVAETLISQVKTRENITVWENTYLADIIEIDGICAGGILIKNGKQINVHSKAVVLATGGIGGLFNNSTNQRQLTGDGIAIALKHNINLKDLEYIQFHPTALYDENKDERRFLISESVRGEGGKLFNINGERFVNELLPRDVVSQAIEAEMEKSGVPYVNLDISFLDEEYIKNRFPAIYKECLSRGIDITREPIPVCPAQHYFMGGIEVDLNSKTSMDSLYAVGETSCTGVHGANRLASNSLLEGLVFSKRAAGAINKEIDKTALINVDPKRINFNIDELRNINKSIAIEGFKRISGGVNDELFNYR